MRHHVQRFLWERLGTAFPSLFWSWERRSHSLLILKMNRCTIIINLSMLQIAPSFSPIYKFISLPIPIPASGDQKHRSHTYAIFLANDHCTLLLEDNHYPTIMYVRTSVWVQL